MFDERFVLRYRREEIDRFQKALLQAVERHEYDQTSSFAIKLALEEALSNAFKHGNRSDPRKTVVVGCKIDLRHVDIEVEDEGPGFDPGCVPDPTQEENIEIPSGRGISLMRAFMSEVHFDPPGNRVRMRFVKPG
jgi:serine/threonine-protein kinase RsbW